ncbi:uncharacterized protein [Ptychodera flava]|uniref:uncharacterized protein n=1 Tax=Ptychodera flava TaxID=63121 RepID=UPI00396A7749
MLRGVLLALVALLSASTSSSASDGVLFPSGNVFQPVELPPGSDADNHEDPYNTGALLFDSTGQEEMRLSLNYHVRDFKSSSSQYFRAHPVLLQCLQKVRTAMYKMGEKVVIANGYNTRDDVSGSSDTHIQYLRSGSAAELAYKYGGTGNKDAVDLADVIVRQCITLFHSIQRDIGLYLYTDKVHVHIQGADEESAYYGAASGAGKDAAELQAWVLDITDEVYDPARTPTCDLTEHTLNNGDHYPTHFSSAEAAVGALDRKVTRDMNADFNRLVQYAGRNIEFENAESLSSWCGTQGRACVDCKAGIKGSTPDSRCADRVMSTRLISVIKYLQMMVRNHWSASGVKLKVLEAWDEPHEGSPNGDHPADSIHYEGRAATLTLSDGDTSKLTNLASFAICSGMDFVQHNGDRIFVAVKKQDGPQQRLVHFPVSDLLAAEAPANDTDIYAIPDIYSSDEKSSMYLFDSDHKEGRKLSNNATIENFKSKTSRYFRLDPQLVECYQHIVTRENKERKENESPVNVVVERAYLTAAEQDGEIPNTDPRYNSHVAGRAMQIHYDTTGLDPKHYTPMRLAKRAVHKCGPLFVAKQHSIAVGVYEKSVYVDIRDNFDAWVESEALLPVNTTEEEFRDDMEKWLLRSVEGRVIDPDNPLRACAHSVEPQKQSPEFEHEHPLPVRRRRAAGTDSDACKPKSDTKHCSLTKGHRDDEVAKIWKQVTRKHLYRKSEDVKLALEGCFGVCGTCQSGTIWLDKIDNCNNFLHWVPFDFYEQHDEVAFYVRENTDLKQAACRGHCIDKAPLFSLVAPSVEELFRPDPQRSVKEPMYSVANNPLPVYDLLYKLYALHATGKVKVYVKDQAELSTLRGPLKMAMIFNKAVTEVKIYVADERKVDSVTSSMENMLLEWTKASCPEHARAYVPPFSIELLPSGITKRSPEHDLREEMLANRKNWEKNWLKSHTLL